MVTASSCKYLRIVFELKILECFTLICFRFFKIIITIAAAAAAAMLLLFIIK